MRSCLEQETIETDGEIRRTTANGGRLAGRCANVAGVEIWTQACAWQGGQAAACRGEGIIWKVSRIPPLGVEAKLVNSRKVRLIAESKNKSDRIDAEVLAQLERACSQPQDE